MVHYGYKKYKNYMKAKTGTTTDYFTQQKQTNKCSVLFYTNAVVKSGE